MVVCCKNQSSDKAEVAWEQPQRTEDKRGVLGEAEKLARARFSLVDRHQEIAMFWCSDDDFHSSVAPVAVLLYYTVVQICTIVISTSRGSPTATETGCSADT